MRQLQSLRVIHWDKLTHPRPLTAGQSLSELVSEFGPATPALFSISTCQRELWIFDEQSWREQQFGRPFREPSISGGPHPWSAPQRFCEKALHHGSGGGAEVYSGSAAYGFLLRFSTGLESAVRGETDVFGQLKDAWAAFEGSGSPQVRELAPWIQRLFEDTKEIRSRYLQSVGGASYGSLVRQLLRRAPMRSSGPILLVGAGPIAQSVAPWLAGSEFGPLWVANRTQARALHLANEVVARQGEAARPRLVGFSLDEELTAWAQARAVVLAVPLDSERDRKRRELAVPGTPIVHLGTLRAEAPEWRDTPDFFALDDLFEIQRQAEGVRGDRFTRALHACEERARLRGMGGSLSIAHGWEDLAAFM